MSSNKEKIAVIGSGISGITAAYVLQRKYDVTLYEKNSYIGGHTNTATVPDGKDAGTPVDTGFIVFNQKTYPNLIKLFQKLDVEYADTDMSFSYYDPSKNIIYNTNGLGGIFFKKKNILNWRYWRFVRGLLKYGKIFEEALVSGQLKNKTLGEFFASTGLPREVIEWLIVPMAAAIWSSSFDDMMSYPAETFTRFYHNHGLLTLFEQPQWYYVKGGSSSYVKKFLNEFKGTVIKNSSIEKVKRGEKKCTVIDADKKKKDFDYVILATHADQALKLLDKPSDTEKNLLGVWSYSKNKIVLHTDISLLPPEKGVWASWNYMPTTKNDYEVNVTYWMNLLQNLKTENDYCVSLNADRPIDSKKIIAEFMYEHPVFSFDSINTQDELPKLNGYKRSYFCGSYFRYGFHEDACASALAAVKHFGLEL